MKYNAPSINALPSLSSEGLDPLAPKYLSSKESNAVSAAACAVSAAVFAVSACVALVVAVAAEVAALLSLVAAAVALLADAVAEFADAVADEAALFCAVVADAASTIKFQAAELVLVVNGCDPLEVCAATQIKILFVDVSFTRSLTSYEVLAAQLPLYVPSSVG